MNLQQREVEPSSTSRCCIFGYPGVGESRMDRLFRSRRAAASKGALIALAVVAVLALAFWGFQLSSGGEGDPKPASQAERDAQRWMMTCEACRHTFPMTQGEIRAAKKSDNGRLECPKCKKFAAVSTRMSPEDYAAETTR